MKMIHRRLYNLERDIKSTEWILVRVRHNEVYAQNLYAAMCNHKFVPVDVWGVLTGIYWYCEWLYAASMIAEIREEETRKWYCSGVEILNPGFVAESVIVPEIEQDITDIGWRIEDLNLGTK